MMTGRVLVLGGTGAIGRHTVPALIARGYEVVVTSRRPQTHAHPAVTMVQGNAKDNAFLAGVKFRFGRFDAVIDFMQYATTCFSARADLLFGISGQYVFVSSARVYAASDELLTEESPRLLDVSTDERYLRTDEYALAKARQENLIVASGRDDWTIVRPGLTFAAGRLQFGALEAATWLWRASRGLPIAQPDILRDTVATMTWAGDTGGIISALVGNAHARAETFHIASGESHTWEHIAQIYRKCLPFDLRWIDYERFERFVGIGAQLRLSRAVNRRFDAGKVLNATGSSGFRPLREAIPQEVAATDTLHLTPEITRNAALDRLTSSSSGLGRGLNQQAFVYWAARHPSLRRAVRAVRRRERA